MADALDSGSSGSNPVRVQVPFSACFERSGNPWYSKGFRSFFCGSYNKLIQFIFNSSPSIAAQILLSSPSDHEYEFLS